MDQALSLFVIIMQIASLQSTLDVNGIPAEIVIKSSRVYS